MAAISPDVKRPVESSATQDLRETKAPSINRAALLAESRSGDPRTDEDVRSLLLKSVSSGTARDELIAKGKEGAVALAKLVADRETSNGAKLVAVELLGQMGYRDSIPALEQVVKDKGSPDALRLKALESIGKLTLDGAPAVASIKETLKDPASSPEVRVAAVKSLGQVRDRAAIDVLSTLVVDEAADPALRSQAIKALETMGTRLGSPALLQVVQQTKDNNLRSEAIDALATLGERQALPAFINAIKDPSTDQGRRIELIHTLGRIGEGTEPLLKEIVLNKADDTGARVAAYGSLISLSAMAGEARLGEVVDFAKSLAKYPELPEELKDISFGVIANLDPKEGPKLIISTLEDKESPVKLRTACLEGVKALKLVEAEPSLLKIVENKEEEPYLRAAAVEALGSLKTTKGADLLVSIAKDPATDPVVANATLKALVEQKDPRVNDLLLERLGDRKGGSLTAPQMLVAVGEKRAIPLLIETIKDESRNSMERRAAIEALSAFADPVAVPALTQVLQKGDPYLAEPARTALVRLGDPSVSKELQGDLRDEKKAKDAIAPLAMSLDPAASIAVMNALQNAHKGDFKEISMKTQEGVMASGGVAAFAGRLKEGAEQVQDPQEKEKILKYADALLTASRLGVQSPFRFSPSGLTELMENRVNNKRDDRPLAIVVYPREDHNGVFSDTASEVDKLIKGGYRVMFYEVANDTEARDALKNASHLGESGEQKASLLVIGGHGDRTTISFGAGDPAAGVIEDTTKTFDLKDLELLQGVSGSLEEGGSIVLISCSNGEGKAGVDNVANLMRKAFPQAGPQRIFSAAEPTRPVELILNSSGRLEDVRFSGDDYRASSSEGSILT